MVSFRPLNDPAEMDVIIDRDTFRTLAIHETRFHTHTALHAV